MLLLLIACPAADRIPIFGDSAAEVCDSPRTERVAAVVDGDTIDLATGERVRLLGIDTPEVFNVDTPECYASDASEALKDLLPEGTEVRLSFDVECTDITNSARTLAYVNTVPEAVDTAVDEPTEALFVNEYMLEKGFARLPENCAFIEGLIHEDTLRRAADRAVADSAGLRGACETREECG